MNLYESRKEKGRILTFDGDEEIKCVWVCVRERQSKRERVCERESEREWGRVWEGARECVCERERERGRDLEERWN
jgi:hypothetical protein